MLTGTTTGEFSTSQEFRIWATGSDGRWRTPAQTSLTDVSDLEARPGNHSRMAVVAAVDHDEFTFLLGLDSDRIHHELCRAHSDSVPATQWKSLFPHLAHRPRAAPRETRENRKTPPPTLRH
ncbi:hypothetical protein [Streptomyces sp. NPDC005890]|uniref:hypothetical protein n=1 Tax=Streptomyces sp. NPDC005890 TaxID=3154568 RepID=UPI0033D397D6